MRDAAVRKRKGGGEKRGGFSRTRPYDIGYLNQLPLPVPWQAAAQVASAL